VATALLVAGSTLTLGRLPLHPPARTRASFKALDCSYNCRHLTYGSFQLTHVTWWPCCLIDQASVSHGSQNEDKTLLQHSQRCHKGEFWYVSISARQQSLRCGQKQNLSWELMTVGLCTQAMADNGKTKGLITPPRKWVSAQLYVCVTGW